MRPTAEPCARAARPTQAATKDAAHTVEMIMLVRRKSGLSQASRGILCRATPSVNGLRISSDPRAMTPSAPEAIAEMYVCSAVCGSANASAVSAAK